MAKLLHWFCILSLCMLPGIEASSEELVEQADAVLKRIGHMDAHMAYGEVILSQSMVISLILSCADEKDIHECAFRRGKAYLKFRDKERAVYFNLTLDNAKLDEMNGGGIRTIEGYTCQGNKVYAVANSQMDWSGSLLEVLQMQVYNHEKLMRNHDAQRSGIIIVQDMSYFSLSQIWKVVRSGGLALTNTFRQRIAKVVIAGEPRMFGTAWKVIGKILPAKLRDSVVFVGSDWRRLADEVAGQGCEGAVREEIEKIAEDRMSQHEEGGRAEL